MKDFIVILLILQSAITAHAQPECSVQHAEVFYYTVNPGTNNTVITIGGKEEPATHNVQTNVTVYLVINSLQKPRIFLVPSNKKKKALDFIRVHTDRDKAGTDESGNPKIIKSGRGSYIWKAACSVEGGNVFSEKKKVMLTGIIGRKKYTSYINPVQLQSVFMY